MNVMNSCRILLLTHYYYYFLSSTRETLKLLGFFYSTSPLSLSLSSVKKGITHLRTQFTFVYYGWPIKQTTCVLELGLLRIFYVRSNLEISTIYANKLPKIVKLWREKYYVCPKFNREHDVNLFINWWESPEKNQIIIFRIFSYSSRLQADRIFIDCNTWG